MANRARRPSPIAAPRPLLRVIGWVIAISGALALALSLLLLIVGVLAYRQSDVYSNWGPAIVVIYAGLGALMCAAATALGVFLIRRYPSGSSPAKSDRGPLGR